MSHYPQAYIRSKKNPKHNLVGYITWETKDDFGFEFMVCETTASMICSFLDWEIIEKER